MHRIFVLLAFAAASYGFWVLFSSPEPSSLGNLARTTHSASGAYGGWALGLLMGLMLAWLTIIDWRDLPERFADWLRLQRRRLALLLIGGLCASVLLLF